MWGGLGKYRGREAERAAESECAKGRPAPVRAVRERERDSARKGRKNKGGRAAKKRLAGEDAGRPTTTTTTKEEVSGI